jgi:hypothetical protein
MEGYRLLTPESDSEARVQIHQDLHLRIRLWITLSVIGLHVTVMTALLLVGR